MEKVSIIVPIYNIAKYLERCVLSLVEQTYSCIEILLVDDCSTDGSLAIAEALEAVHSNKCRVIRCEKHGGAARARNIGMEAAYGKWLIFVDGDDWVTPDYVETLYNTAQKDGADIVMSGFYYYYASGKCVEVSTFGDLTTDSPHREKVALCDAGPTARLFRASLFFDNHIAFPEDIWRAEDIATIIPISTMTDKISFVPRSMYYYFQRSNSLSNRNLKNADISFFPKMVLRMIELARPGFEKELEFRAVSELLYGMVTVMLRSGRTAKDLREHIDWFNGRFPHWRENAYIRRLPKCKQIFISFAAKKRYWISRALIFAWDTKQRLSFKKVEAKEE